VTAPRPPAVDLHLALGGDGLEQLADMRARDAEAATEIRVVGRDRMIRALALQPDQLHRHAGRCRVERQDHDGFSLPILPLP
jgi:hypothetical protein